MKVRKTMRIREARASASRLAQALEAYQAQMNLLPVHKVYDAESDADGFYQNSEIIAQLNGIMRRDPLMMLEEEERNEYGSYKDPWGRPFRVIMWKALPGDAYYRYFQIYSCGPNAKWELGAEDDLAPKL
jgi:hypothetical protein